jgi:hypothetical protein
MRRNVVAWPAAILALFQIISASLAGWTLKSMCGFAGFVDSRCAHSAERWAHTAAAMAAPLRHRGPDDAGVWIDPAAGVALAHRRLAVLDLSPAGLNP